MKMQRFLIIGSGLAGRLTAWRLLASGHQVTIASVDDITGSDSAGFVAAAMVAPLTETVTGELALKSLGQQSQWLWSQWLAELDERVFYPQTGTLVVAHPGDQSELTRFRHRADFMLAPGDYQPLDQDQLNRLSPSLSANFNQALWFADEHCLDNRQFYQHIGAYLQQHADWQQIEPLDSITEDSLRQLCEQQLDCRHYSEFDKVIDCRGNGARQDIDDLRSVRGEVVRVYAPEVQLKQCVRLMHPRYPIYLAPRPDHHYVIGATVIESDDRSPVSVRSAMELLSALYTIDPGFAEARVEEMQAHCRPALPSHLPRIDKKSWGYQLNGLYRHGYLLAPAMVDQLLKQMGVSTPSFAGVQHGN